VEDGAGACARLQAAVAGRLVALGVHAGEARAFRPHVTVARVRRGARVPRRLPGGPPPLGFDGAALTLYRSRPGSGGARYEALARAVLPPPTTT
jgi:RNA 2',3'-cyclic 3'-phosphodiesterase